MKEQEPEFVQLDCNYTPTKPCAECEGLRATNRRLLARVAELEAAAAKSTPTGTCETCEDFDCHVDEYPCDECTLWNNLWEAKKGGE